jgi:hypothetical protein
MPTRLSKPSHLLKLPHFSMPSPQLKLFTMRGLPESTKSSIFHSKRRFMLQRANSISTTRRLWSQMPTFSRCVRVHFNWAFFSLIIRCVVLHPEHKMAHFKKNWGKRLQEDVTELGQKIVRLSLTLLILAVRCRLVLKYHHEV